MQQLQTLEQSQITKSLPDIRPGDTVRIHTKIREGSKERIQVFEGLVIRRRSGSGLRATVTVRRIASGVGVERTFMLHSALITRIQITKRTGVRRAFLSYMRERRGKASRLTEKRFDRVDMAMEAPRDEPTESAKADADEPQVPGEDAPADLPDAEVTELDTEDENQADVVESTEELAEGEEKVAAAEESSEPAVQDPDENTDSAVEASQGVADAGADRESPVQKGQTD